MNSLTISGRLGRDPELKTLPNGNSLVNASVAVNDGYMGKDKQWVDKSVWVDFTVWGEQAERFADRYKKGDHVGIQGKLSEETWDDKVTGEKRKKLVMKPFSFEPLGAGKGKGGGDQASAEDEEDGGDGKEIEVNGETVKLGF